MHITPSLISTGLVNVTIMEGITTITNNTFRNCNSLTSITLPNSVKVIGDGAFSGCSSLVSGSLGSITWSLNKETGEMAFTGEGEIMDFSVFPSDVYRHDNHACYTNSPWLSQVCNIKKLVINNGITSIGSHSFYGCSSLASFILPDGLVSIKRFAFADCPSLKAAAIPKSVKNIESNAFNNCRSLKSVEISKAFSKAAETIFSNCINLHGFIGYKIRYF